jgi:hypothetical protein
VQYTARCHNDLEDFALGQHGHDEFPQGTREIMLGRGERQAEGFDEVDGLLRDWPVSRRTVQGGLAKEVIPAGSIIASRGVQGRTADAAIAPLPGQSRLALMVSAPSASLFNPQAAARQCHGRPPAPVDDELRNTRV